MPAQSFQSRNRILSTFLHHLARPVAGNDPASFARIVLSPNYMNTLTERPDWMSSPVKFTTKVRTYDLGRTLVPRETVLLAFRGSVAHGMFVDPKDPNGIDDVDLIGVTIPEEKYYLGLSEWGSRGTKEFREGVWDGVFYDVRKIVSLLMQGNPNVLSLLWTKPEHRLGVSSSIEPLIESRRLFLGKHVFNAFAGYANAQLIKMESRDPAELRQYLAVTTELKRRGRHPNHKGVMIPYPEGYDNSRGENLNALQTSDDVLLGQLRSFQKKGENIGYMGDKRKRLVLDLGYDSKNAAHCIRLLRMCVEFLNTGSMTVYRPDAGDDQELLAIKRGEWTLEQVKKEAADLFQAAREARDSSPLPDEPDRDRIEKLLIHMIWERWKD